MEGRAMSNNLREQLLAKTAGIRATDERRPDTSRRANRTETAPGMAGALAAAQLRVQELESTGTSSQLPVADIVPNPWQPRRVFNQGKLTDLAESIREVGLMQPIVVRRSETGYQIVAGERRWRAHQILGMVNIRTVVIECSDQEMIVLALVENMDRDDLSDYEVAIAIRRSESEFPNRKRLAESLGMSRTGLYQYLSFDNLPDFIKKDLDLQPGLIGCNAAEEVVSALKKYGSAGETAARELWPDVVKGALPQGKFAPTIIAIASRRAPGSVARERSIEKFFAGNEQAGSITKDAHHFTVKIKAGALTEAQEGRIRQLISDLYGEPRQAA
jgi:ParB family transcriptional regulator, chromosome partitioning protein